MILPIILAFGFPLELRRLTAKGDHEAALRTARLWCLLGFVPSGGCALFLHFTLFAGFDQVAKTVATIGVAAAPFAASWICDNGVLLGQERYLAVFFLLVSQPFIYVLLVVVLWMTGMCSVATVLFANLAGTFTAFVLGICFTRLRPHGSLYPAKQLLHSSTKFAGSAISEVISNRVDQAIALPLMGAHEAGLYSIAATVASAPIALGQALGASYFGVSARSDPDSRRVLASESIRVSFIAGVSTVPVLGVVAIFAIPFVFGSEFTESVVPSLICLFASLAGIVSYVISMVLAAGGKGWSMTAAQTLGLVVGTATLFAIGSNLGAVGGAIASVCSATVILLGLLLAAKPVPQALIFRRDDLRTALSRLTRPGGLEGR
jgi:O-antigen/teichoic acid export membrane protein